VETEREKIGFLNELFRKGIHLTSSIIPLFYWVTNIEYALIFTGVIVFLMIMMDILRKISNKFDLFYKKVLWIVLRKREFDPAKHLFTGGTYLVIGDLLSILLFPKSIAIMAMFIVRFSDSFAALIGKHFGKIRVGSKTLEGTFTFFLVTVLIVYFFPKVTISHNELSIAFSSAIIVSIFEILPVKIDDNVLIPIVFGGCYTLLLNLILF